MEFGGREQLRGLGEELFRIDRRDGPMARWDEEYFFAWSDLFSDLLANVDPDLHDTLHPYDDLALLKIHGEKLLDIAIRLASQQQWLHFIGPSAFVAASTGTSVVFIRFLASWGGPVEEGTLAQLLITAAEGGSVDILSALIAAGAGPLVRMVWVVEEVCLSMPTLHIAAERGHRSFVAKLIEAGAPVEAKTIHGKTALTVAIRHRHKGVVLELIASGVNVNAMEASFRPRTRGSSVPLSHSDFDPLHIAVENKDEEMVDILLEAGAEPSKEAMHVLPLHTAARQGSCRIMNSLLLAGARVDAVDTTGRSALHLACAYSQPDAVEILLRHNASVGLLNNGGFSPVDVVGAQVFPLRKWSQRWTEPRRRWISRLDLERELQERGVNPGGLGERALITRPSTLNSAETSTVNAICDMLTSASAWGRRGWLVIMRCRPLAEVVAEQPDRSHADAFALSVRDTCLVYEPSSNTAGLCETGRAAHVFRDGDSGTTGWSAAVICLLLSLDDSLFRHIVLFL